MPRFWDNLNLAVHLLTFEVQATTRMVLPPFKGSTFRGAWKNVLTQAYCPASPEDRARPDHADACAACYLTERETGPEARKPYALRPPLTRETDFPPGAQLTFGFVLFGPAWLLLPYILSAVKTMGEVQGVGRRVVGPGPRKGRGRFRLRAAYVEHPLRTPGRELMYAEGQQMVFAPQNGAITADEVRQATAALLEALPDPATLRLHFRSPLRVVHQKRLMRRFAFEPFFRRLIERLFMLAEEFGDPPLEDARAMLRAVVPATQPLVEQVRVVEDRTWWWDLKGYSSRLKREQPMGGLMGEVVLQAPKAVWETLLLPILWGQFTHVGKNAVKGQGWYEIGKSANRRISGFADQRRGE